MEIKKYIDGARKIATHPEVRKLPGKFVKDTAKMAAVWIGLNAAVWGGGYAVYNFLENLAEEPSYSLTNQDQTVDSRSLGIVPMPLGWSERAGISTPSELDQKVSEEVAK